MAQLSFNPFQVSEESALLCHVILSHVGALPKSICGSPLVEGLLRPWFRKESVQLRGSCWCDCCGDSQHGPQSLAPQWLRICPTTELWMRNTDVKTCKDYLRWFLPPGRLEDPVGRGKNSNRKPRRSRCFCLMRCSACTTLGQGAVTSDNQRRSILSGPRNVAQTESEC